MRAQRSTRASAVNREVPAASRIPYSSVLDEYVVRTDTAAYVMGFKLGGASFECADGQELNSWHERLHALWRNIATPHVALWTHLIRERATLAPEREADDGFAGRLARRYHDKLAGRVLWTNSLYFTVVYRPTIDAASGLAARLIRTPDAG